MRITGERMLSITSSKVTTTPGPSGWVQVHEFFPEDIEKRTSRGHLFAVIATKRFEAGVEGIAAGRELIARLQEEYFGDLTLKPFNALKTSCEKVISEFASSWGDVEIAACAVTDNVVYSAAGGGAEVVICRDGMLATILASEGGAVISASGFPKSNDSLLLGTGSFFKNISGGVIKASLENKNAEEAAEIFGPLIHGEDGSGSMGAVIIKFAQEAVPEVFPAISSVAPAVQKFRINEKVDRFKNKFLGFFSRLSKKMPEQGIYVKPGGVDDAFSKSKKLSFTVAVILLALLGVSIVFGIKQNRSNSIKASYSGKLAEAQNDLDQAISISGVDATRARALFGTSQDLYNQILALKIKDPKIDELGRKIDQQRGAILGEYRENAQLFWDLSLLSAGFKGDAVSESAGNVYILDKNGKRVVGIEIGSKKSSVIAGPDKISQALGVASYTNSVFVLDSDGIYEVDADRQKVVDKTWTGEAFIQAYTGNLYVLDKDINAIYRYAGENGTFGPKQNWLSSDTKPDFSGARSWAIDGSMYVLFPGAKILKFSLGSPQNFLISGANPNLTNIDAIYASDDAQGIYLLDRAGKRVVVLGKNGEYKAQYVSDKIAEATGLVVSEADKEIILLTGDKLYSLDIKHIQ